MKNTLFRRVVALALALSVLLFGSVAFAENSDDSLPLQDGWWNILLLGCDSYTQHDYSRSDSMIILSLNPETNEAKMTSIMRDTWVHVAGTKTNRKLTEVCAVGGPQKTLDTINENFSTQLTDYALVSMKGVANIIDLVGGVEVDVTEKERKALNKGLFDLSDYSGKEQLTTSGEKVHLNGNQATAFSRIRKIDSDFVRVERQQTVLEALANKIMQDADIGTLIKVATELMPYVDTNLTFAEITKLAYIGMNTDLSGVETLRIPVEGSYKSGLFNGVYSIRPNYDTNKKAIHDFIYG